MALTTYLEFDEVRAALGVNNLELKDTVLTLPVYEMGLVRELNRISTSLPAAFSTAVAKQPDARTDAEDSLVSSVHLFAVYVVAKQVGVSLPTFAPKDIGDGKATVSRFAGTPFDDTLARVDAAVAAYRSDLVTEWATYTAADAPKAKGGVQFIGVKRSTDPVTGV